MAAVTISTLSSSCFLLRLPEAHILLDCPLDLSCLGAFVPQYFTHTFHDAPSSDQPQLVPLNGVLLADAPLRFRTPRLDLIDVSAIDLVLVSSTTGLLGLPFLLRNPRFRGRVYATEPVLELGRQLMEELVHFTTYAARSRPTASAQSWRTLASLPAAAATAATGELDLPIDTEDSLFWAELYTREDVALCVQRVHRCSFMQDIPSYGNLHLRPSSSGHALGACNWTIAADQYKLVFLGPSSSVTSRHPEPLDFRPLMNANLVLATGFSHEPSRNPDQMINDLCTYVLTTVKRRGNVLIPCLPTGVVYDLIEVLAAYLTSMNMLSVPIYLISPVVDQSLGYANICGEWMSRNRQDKTFLPEPPFSHADLVRSGRVQQFPNLHGSFGATMKSPAVVFAGHPSLRCGDAVHFIRLWGPSSRNTIIFIDPEYPTAVALAPYHPLAMRVCYTPIDPGLTYTEANALLDRLRPAHLCVLQSDVASPPACPDGINPPAGRPTSCTFHVLPDQPGESISIPVIEGSRIADHAKLSEKLSRDIQLTPLGTKRVQRVGAVLSLTNHQLVLHPPSKQQMRHLVARRRHLLFGHVTPQPLLDSLMASDVGAIDVETAPDQSKIKISLPAQGASISIEGNKTTVKVANRETRLLLKRILLQQLEQL